MTRGLNVQALLYDGAHEVNRSRFVIEVIRG